MPDAAIFRLPLWLFGDDLRARFQIGDIVSIADHDGGILRLQGESRVYLSKIRRCDRGNMDARTSSGASGTRFDDRSRGLSQGSTRTWERSLEGIRTPRCSSGGFNS